MKERARVILKNVTAGLVARFAAIVGEANAVSRAEDQSAYLREWRDRYVGKTPVVLRPGGTDEVAKILALAHAEGVGIVPQGGNTGLVGAQIPSADGNEIILSLSRMDRIRDVDADEGTMVVEAGVTLAAAQTAAAGCRDETWFLPLSLASEGSAQIGGVLASNAGGTGVLTYGNARAFCLGIEAVLADGRVWHGVRRLKKDNTGYDLRDLLIGSEGTLGVITAAALKLVPRPAETASAIIALNSPEATLKLFTLAQGGAGGMLTAFEFWSAGVQEFALRYMPGTRAPLREAYPWYALLEISAFERDGQAARVLERLLARASEAAIIEDAAVGASLEHQRQFWHLRDAFSEAQKGAGGSIKHDVSVPVARIPEFLVRAGEVVARVCPGARPVPFGHFGDGNVHYNVSQPVGMDKAAYVALWDRMADGVHALVAELGGSFSAEHGVGRMKRGDLLRYKPHVEVEMMRAIKHALDPKGILNPGKLL